MSQPKLLSLAAALLCAGAVQAAPVAWTQWTADTGGGAHSLVDGHMELEGDRIVDVDYEGELRYRYPNAGGEYYWDWPGTFSGGAVDNVPGSSFLQLNRGTAKQVSFSQPLTGVVMAVMSLNDNYYEFDHDFVIETQGCATFGCGTLSKQRVDGKYRLVGSGEGNGVIRFVGEVSTLGWTTHHAEDWQGVTFGAIAAPVPEPATWTLSLAGAGLLWARRRARQPA